MVHQIQTLMLKYFFICPYDLKKTHFLVYYDIILSLTDIKFHNNTLPPTSSH